MNPKQRLKWILLAIVAGCLAGCISLPVFSPEIPLQKRAVENALSTSELTEAVRTHEIESDYGEFFDDWLVVDPRGPLLFLKGVIVGDTFVDMYYTLYGEPTLDTLVMTDIPGSADDETNLAMGRALHEAGMTTYLPKRAIIASGGTDLFLAGKRRIVERGAQIGVHSWSSGLFFGPSANDLPKDHPDHEMFLEYYREIGISEDFYWFTLEAAPPSDIHWMTEEEMAKYGIYTELIDE